MKQTILYLIAAIAIVSASSCTKDEQLNINEQSGARIIELTFDNGDATKVGLSERTPQWEVGDKIWLSNGTNSEEVTLIAADITGNVAKITTSLQGTLYAVYPASAQNGVSGGKIGFKIPTSTDGAFGNAHISVAVGTTTLTFKNVVSILKFDVGADTLINVSSSANIAGEFKVTYGDTPSIEAGTNQAKSIMVSASSNRDTYIAVASGVAFSAFEFTAIKTAKDWAYKKSSSATTTAVNTIYPIGKVSDWNYTKIGSLWAKFSTSASTKVRFSKGNLYCDKKPAPDQFWFEDNQYDFRHYPGKPKDKHDSGNYNTAVINGESTATPSYTRGSFYWSSDQDYACEDDFPTDKRAISDEFFTNETTTTPKVYFTVQGLPGVWRTLSGGDSGEWEWLLGPDNSPTPGTNCRTSSTINGIDNARYAAVKVNNCAGLLIFPDAFTWPSDVTSKPSTFNTNSSNWNNVNYSKTDFARLETAGCVFLPASGYRTQFTIQEIGTKCDYWSSTAHENNENQAYHISFTNSSVNPNFYGSRGFGYPVRLVTAAK